LVKNSYAKLKVMKNKKQLYKEGGRKGFTLFEVLVVVGVLIVLALIVIYTLNPHQAINQGQDSNRVAGIGTLDKAISLYYSDAITNPASLYLGSSSVRYISIPDPTATTTAGTNCGGLGFPTSPVYHCAASSTYMNTNGTGWVPINFTSYSGGTIIPTLPIDPINTTSSGEYYVYITNGTQYELMANPASTEDASDTSDFVKGTNLSLETSFPVLTASGFIGGNIWVIDSNNERVEEFNSSGTYLSQFGSNGGGNGEFSNPNDIAIDASGNIWVTDAGNDRVQEFSSNGTYLSQFGSDGRGNGQFYTPYGIAIDASGNIWVTDSLNNRVEEFNSSGTYLSQFGTHGSGNGQLNGPGDIAIDASGNIWVADANNNRVEEFNSSGTYLSQFGSNGGGNGQLSSPYGIAIDASGNIWVTDSANDRVQEFSSNGTYLSQFGSNGGGNGEFSGPLGIAAYIKSAAQN
jgi:sugar lactone lactonase YvrE/type II secretory pathway pseudopilin PulG